MMKKKVVVIGAGLAGSLICNELVKHFDVTLLEKGNRNSIEYPKIEFIKKKLAEVNTFCFGGGGTTNLWHNGLIPLNNNDISHKEFHEVLSDAHQFMDKAAASLFFKKASYSQEYEQLRSEFNKLTEKAGVFEEGIDCLIYPKKFKKLEVGSGINDFYEVDKIDFISENRQITFVDYSIGDKKYSVASDWVIVSAGAFGTPKILNQILSSAGNRCAPLGVGFIDHPMGFVGKVKFNKEVSGLIKKLALFDKGNYISRNAVRIKSECKKYTCCAFFRPALTMENNLSLYKYKSLIGASNGTTRLRNAYSLKIFHPDILAEIFSHIFGFNIPGRIYGILLLAEQKRNNNRVYYDGDRLKVDWSITDEEIFAYQSVLKKLKKMLSNLADNLNMEINITEEWLWSAAHHSCTTSMGNTDNDLIDKNLKLKCYDNVFVCDGSVIQEHSYANTGLTIGQLAFYLADRILDASKK
jgi:hypothetical protein